MLEETCKRYLRVRRIRCMHYAVLCALDNLECVRVAYTDAQGSRELTLQHTTHVANGHACV